MFDFNGYARSANRRMTWLGWGIGLVFFVFAFRLFYIQVVQGSYYADIAKQNQVTKLTIFPERGTIYAMSGDEDTVPLVMNETVYTVFADPYEVKDIRKVEEALKRIAGGEVVNDSLQYLNDTSRRYLVLARQVSRKQAELIQKENLAGVGLQKGTRRIYPEGQLASQLLGYVNADGEGLYGVEGALDDRLMGSKGVLQSITDVRRIPLTIGNSSVGVPAVNGDNIVLSVDRNAQFELERVLKAHYDSAKPEHSSALIMDPNTGQVLAMANYPTYDPNNYSQVTDYSLFQNRITGNAYEPGSVMKTLTVAAGLDQKVISPTSTFYNPGGCTRVEDATICNVIRNGILNPTTQQTLVYSFNTGAVSVLRSLGGGTINKGGRDKLYDYFTNRFRMGEATGIEQANEADGVIYSPEDEQGNDVRYANMTFGQGMQVTMMQFASAFSATVNGGTYYRPTLVYGTEDAQGNVTQQQPTVVQQGVISPEYSAEMRDLVWHSRYDNNGKKDDPAGYHVAGKSGTAQTIDPKTGKYTADRTVGSYIGYVSSASGMPEYVIMVRMDFAAGGTYGGSYEANTAYGELARWLIHYKGIPPN